MGKLLIVDFIYFIASLLDAAPPLNSTAFNLTAPANSSAVPAKRRNVPDARWSTRARLDATTLPAGDPALNQVTA